MKDHPLITDSHGLWVVALVPNGNGVLSVWPCQTHLGDGVNYS